MALIRLNTHPSRRQLLVFALAWLVFVGLLGLGQWLKLRPGVAAVCWTLAVVVPAAGAAWPAGLRWLYVGLSYATYPVGFVVSSLVLVVIYYVVLTPIGLALRLGRHDLLERGFDPRAGSYWRRRPGPRPPASYFRQL